MPLAPQSAASTVPLLVSASGLGTPDRIDGRRLIIAGAEETAWVEDRAGRVAKETVVHRLAGAGRNQFHGMIAGLAVADDVTAQDEVCGHGAGRVVDAGIVEVAVDNTVLNQDLILRGGNLDGIVGAGAGTLEAAAADSRPVLAEVNARRPLLAGTLKELAVLQNKIVPVHINDGRLPVHVVLEDDIGDLAVGRVHVELGTRRGKREDRPVLADAHAEHGHASDVEVHVHRKALGVRRHQVNGIAVGGGALRDRVVKRGERCVR